MAIYVYAYDILHEVDIWGGSISLMSAKVQAVCVCSMHVKKNTSTIPLFPEVCFSPQTATSQSPCWSTVVPMDFSQMHKVFASSQDPREACDRNPNQAIARGGSLAEFEVSVKGYAMPLTFGLLSANGACSDLTVFTLASRHHALSHVGWLFSAAWWNCEGLTIDSCERLAPNVARITSSGDHGSGPVNVVVKQGSRLALQGEAAGLDAIREASEIFKVPKVLCFKADTPSRLNSFSWQCVIEIYWDTSIEIYK